MTTNFNDKSYKEKKKKEINHSIFRKFGTKDYRKIKGLLTNHHIIKTYIDYNPGYKIQVQDYCKVKLWSVLWKS